MGLRQESGLKLLRGFHYETHSGSHLLRWQARGCLMGIKSPLSVLEGDQMVI